VRSLSGRDLAASIRAATAQRAAELTAAGAPPRLAVVTATADPESAWYVRFLGAAAAKGRSAVVGKPVSYLLLSRDATVTICHSRTPDLGAVTRQASILVVAAGRAGLIGPAHVGSGAVVIDVGINPAPDGGIVGDVDPSIAAAALSPVPGGVGPVTTALLLRHVVQATDQATTG
jgi:methylenetetrahydrofolate dehydrogenase (NADP+) / methenyltetrahydrofolate cyclohydrolase